MAESTTTTPPEDVVGEILLRVDDLATLFRCATTCKSWRRLVAKPHFLLRRQWPPSLVGFFFTKRCHGTRLPGMFLKETGSSSELVFVPLPGSSLLGTRPRALSSFIRAHDAAAAAAADRAMPLATRGGLLLVRLYLHDNDMKRNTFSFKPVCNPIVGLAVCNLLAGTWEVLPELSCQSKFGYSDKYGYEIIAGDDGSSSFKVLMIGADKDKAQFNLHTYASGEASWRAPTKCFDMMERQTWLMEHKEAVVCGGYAHWLFVSSSGHFHVLRVDVETGHVSLTKLRSPTKDRYSPMARRFWGATRLATTKDGTSLTLCKYNGSRLEIWTRHQEDGHKGGDGDEDWVRTGEIDHNLTELIQQFAQASCIWSGGRSGAMLITESYRTHIAHLDTGTLEEATDQFPDRAGQGIIPMEMEIDWPTFFMLRLGGSN